MGGRNSKPAAEAPRKFTEKLKFPFIHMLYIDVNICL